MAHPKQLTNQHVPLAAALPYKPSASPTSGEIVWVAGNDLIANINGWLERRPGFADEYEGTPTTFAAGTTIRRLFGWRLWGSSFFVMVNTVSATQSIVYKLKVGTDASFVSLFTSTSTEPFDFVSSNNYLYFANGTDSRKWDGAAGSTTQWGIDAPTDIPRGGFTGTAGGSAIWVTGTKFSFAFRNTTTGHLSNLSAISGSSGAIAAHLASYAGVVFRSADAQVDKLVLFRTTDGGAGIFFEDGSVSNPAITTVGPVVFNAAAGGATPGLNDMTSGGSYSGATYPDYFVTIDGAGTPDTFKWSNTGVAADGTVVYNATGVAITGAAQTLANGVTVTFAATTGHTLNDSWSFGSGKIGLDSGGIDTGLSSSTTAVFNDANSPPPDFKGAVFHADRIWGFNNDTVYFSGFEEITEGVEEESFPPGNTFRFGAEVTGLAPSAAGLLVFTSSRVHIIEGDALDNFRRRTPFERMGARNRAAITSIGKAVAWLDSRNVIRITDGYTQSEIGQDIRTDISSIDHSQASLAYHYDGKRAYLMLLDGGAGKIRVLDMDLNYWLPPWVIGGRSIGSVETAEGTWKLLLGHTSRKVMQQTLANYNDDGTTYAPTAKLNLVNVAPPGHTGALEYFAVESDGTQPSAITILRDEDPATGTYAALTANIIDSPLRTQGANLKEKWYYDRAPLAKRVSLRMTWPDADANFKLYSIDLASLEGQR